QEHGSAYGASTSSGWQWLRSSCSNAVRTVARSDLVERVDVDLAPADGAFLCRPQRAVVVARRPGATAGAVGDGRARRALEARRGRALLAQGAVDLGREIG